MLKKILLALIFVITATTSVTYAEDDMKTAASKAYVDTKIETKQLKIPAAGQPNVGAGETVMTYTATGNGQIGERGLYSDISSYDATTDGDKLITASALNATFTNLPTTPTTKLECANESDGCTLWTIVDQTAYAYKLPDGYTRLQYIESSGTQYIDTELKLTQDNTVEVEYNYHTASNIATSGRMFGARYTSSPRNAFALGSQTGRVESSTTVFSSLGNTNVVATNNIVIGEWDTYKVSSDGFYIDDVLQGTFPVATFETPFTVKLFAFEQASSSSGTPTVGGGVGRCRRFKVYQGDTLVMDLIPAKNPTNDIGMYDLVSGQFFTNQGTGDFVAGDPVN